MNQTPAVSVLIAASGALPHLPHAIETIQRQTLADWELILILNGCADDSARWLEALHEERLRMLVHPPLGMAAALNVGLAHCRAELVARLDADDAAEPELLAAQHAFLLAQPAIAVVGSQATLIDDAGRVVGAYNAPTDPAEIRRRMFRQNCLIHTTVMYRKSVVLDAGGYNPQFPIAADYDLFLRLNARAQFANLPERSNRYRVHSAQATGQSRLINAVMCYTARVRVVR